MRMVLALVLTAVFFGQQTARAEEEAAKPETKVVTQTVDSHRLTDRIGAYASLYGDPYPGILGVNLAYNVYEWVRVNVGVGTDDLQNPRISTLGAGIKFMVPNLPLTPVAGFNFGSVLADDLRDSITGAGISTQGNYLYANFGADWLTGLGLNFGAGLNYSFYTGRAAGYLNAGVFL